RCSARAVGDGDERWLQLLQPLDGFKQFEKPRIGLRGEELEAERGGMRPQDVLDMHSLALNSSVRRSADCPEWRASCQERLTGSQKNYGGKPDWRIVRSVWEIGIWSPVHCRNFPGFRGSPVRFATVEKKSPPAFTRRGRGGCAGFGTPAVSV